MDIKNRKWLLLVSVAAIILFLVVFFLNVSDIRDYESSPSAGAHPVRIPIFYRLLLSPALLMVAAIFITYYLITSRLEEKLEKNMEIISKIIGKNNQNHKEKRETGSKDIILKFLNPGERKVLEILIERNGEVLQSEISRLDGMTKLKTHRAVRDLERKGIIKVESFGKTNRIVLSKDVREVMFR